MNNLINDSDPEHDDSRDPEVDLEDLDVDFDDDDDDDVDDVDNDSVEKYVYNPPPTAINIRLSLQDDGEYNDVPNVETLKVVATDGTNGSKVASIIAYVFYRDEWSRKDFFTNMYGFSQETLELASIVFDYMGRMKKKYINKPAWKGSGAFSDHQLDSGPMVVVDKIEVSRVLRRKGIGRRMVELMLEKVRSEEIPWLFTWPTQLNNAADASEEFGIYRRNKQVAISFWRSVGFRRVGNSCWFCYATDENHKSRAINATEDYDPPPERDPNEVRREMEENCPFHMLLLKCEEGIITTEELIRVFDEELTKYHTSSPKWTTTDVDGCNILHRAILTRNLAGIKWIRAHLGTILDSKRNNNGNSPLDEMKMVLEDQRDFCSKMGVDFKGHHDEDIECLLALQDESADRSSLHLKRLKYGCTCGNCLEGFISPRMKSILSAQAEICYGMLADTEMDDEPFDSSYPAAFTRHTTQLASVDESYRLGCLQALLWVSEALHRGLIPNTENIQSLLQNGQQLRERAGCDRGSNQRLAKFLTSGGTVAEVVYVVQNFAKNDDVFIEPFLEEIEGLPTCRNDEDFDLIRVLIGNK